MSIHSASMKVCRSAKYVPKGTPLKLQPQPKELDIIEVPDETDTDHELHGIFSVSTTVMKDGKPMEAVFEQQHPALERPLTPRESKRVSEIRNLRHRFLVLRLDILRALGGAETDEDRLSIRTEFDTVSTQLTKARLVEPYLYVAAGGSFSHS